MNETLYDQAYLLLEEYPAPWSRKGLNVIAGNGRVVAVCTHEAVAEYMIKCAPTIVLGLLDDINTWRRWVESMIENENLVPRHAIEQLLAEIRIGNDNAAYVERFVIPIQKWLGRKALK